MKNTILIFISLMLFALTARAGRLMDADHASESELVSAGATKAQLLNDTKIYISAEGLNKTLDDAIIDGDIGGGAGGSRLNLVEHPSFEKDTTEGTCTNCTLTSESTEVLTSPNNEKSLKIESTSASAKYFVDKTTSSQWHNDLNIIKKVWIKTSASDVKLVSRIAGAVESV